MKIISLSSNIAGPACAVALSIKKYYNNDYKTNFFDFLEVSLLSIIQVLQTKDIDNILRGNNKIILNKDDKNSVFFNNFDKMISHHDLLKIYTDFDYNNLIDKYKRRYERLINSIKEEKIIYFIRYGFEDSNIIKYFINSINKINPNLEIYFINVNYDINNLDINNLNKNIKNYYYVNFNNYIDSEMKYSDDMFYKTLEFKWDIVFDLINKTKINKD